MKLESPKLTLQYFPVTKIKLPPYQPRLQISHQELCDLAESISQSGIIQPLYVYMDNDDPILVAGERRWRAAKMAKLAEVPCIVSSKSLTEKERLILAMSENLHRVDLDHWEMAQGLVMYREHFNLTLADIVSLHGGTESKWSRYLKINKACTKLQEAVRQKSINSIVVIGHLIDIEQIDIEFAQEVLDNLLEQNYHGTAEQYAKESKDRVKAADHLGYMPPNPDGNGRYDETHPNVVRSDWAHKHACKLTTRMLQIGKRKWVGGYLLQLGRSRIEVPLSDAFIGSDDAELKSNLSRHLRAYIEGLAERTTDSLTLQGIEKLHLHLIEMSSGREVLTEKNSRRKSDKSPVAIRPESMTRSEDKIVLVVDKKEILLDIDELKALM